MEKKKTAPAPQQTTSAEESATIRLKEAHSKLMDIQAEINKADALLTPAITGTLTLEELNEVRYRLNLLLVSMYRSLSSAAFYTEDALYTTSLVLDRCKRPYANKTVRAVRGDR